LKGKENLCRLYCRPEPGHRRDPDPSGTHYHRGDHPRDDALPDDIVHRDPDPGGTHSHRGDHPRNGVLPDNMVPVHTDTSYYVQALEQGSDTR